MLHTRNVKKRRGAGYRVPEHLHGPAIHSTPQKNGAAPEVAWLLLVGLELRLVAGDRAAVGVCGAADVAPRAQHEQLHHLKRQDCRGGKQRGGGGGRASPNRDEAVCPAGPICGAAGWEDAQPTLLATSKAEEKVGWKSKPVISSVLSDSTRSPISCTPSSRRRRR